ncbi:MAG: response regulator [Hyphomicrobiaceae bacterium]
MTNVFLIDDDPSVLHAIGALLRSFDYSVHAYESAEAFLAAPYAPGCIVSDLRMPGFGGLDLIAALREKDDPRALILLTAHGDVDLAVQALKHGALDFLQKPFDEERLLEAIANGVTVTDRRIREHQEIAELRRRFESLSKRQKEVLWLVAAGCPNKEISARLRISVRTVETYRAWVLERMQAQSLAELIRHSITLAAAGVPSGAPPPSGGPRSGTEA